MKYLLLIVLFSSSFAHSQDDHWFEARGKAGFLAAHRPIMGHLAEEHAFAGEITYMKQAKGSKAWHQAYRMPVYGASLFYGSVGNTELLGHYLGGYGFISYPLWRIKAYTLYWKMGAGIGYGTRVYDQDSNPLSVPISTHFNAMVVLGSESRFLIKKRHEVVVGIDMTHFSNGATKVPNLGINLPYLSLGYGFRIGAIEDTQVVVHPPFKKAWEFGLIGVLSAKEVFPIGTGKYPIYSGSLLARRYFGPKAGAELSFDVISKQAILGYHKDVPKTQADIIQLGVFLGYILPMDRFHLLFGMGAYVRDLFSPEDPVYHRIGMRYVFRNGINLNLVLKTHYARADYIEYGIGYTFRYEK